ncbi:MAG: bifunctional nicotinamidase/pyrazinamidase [Planctomycetota bacterium]
MRHALILVDIQNDFMPDGALPVSDGDAVVPVANRLAHRYPVVAASQDWHPPDHGSFASVHPGKEPFEVIELNGLEQVLWPPHCIQDTWGAEFHPQLERKPIQQVFRKGVDPAVDSYSAFFDNGRRSATGLHEWLQEREVHVIDVLGLATEVCVQATASDARELGYRTRLVLPGCRAAEVEPGDGARAVAALCERGVEILEQEPEMP